MLYGRKVVPLRRPMKKPVSQTPSIQSLDRGLFILEAVAKSSDPVPLGELTDLLGIDRSSVFRLANTLKRRGFLANPSGRKDYILGHLTDLLGIDRSSVFRLANTLKRRGFLANPSGRKDYILGPSIWRLSRNNDWSDMLITFSHEHLKKLAVRTGETTHLAVKEGKQAFFIDHYSASRQLIMVSGQVGQFVPLYCTAHGKALLADYGVEEIKANFGNGP